jgi:hypothetical protein
MDAHPRAKRRRLGWAWLWLALVVLQPCPADSPPDGSETSRLRELQAAVLYHLLQYVEGLPVQSAPTTTPLEVAVLGSDPFGASLDQMSNHNVDGRPIIVRRGLTFEDVERSDVIFVSDSELGRVVAILQHFAERPKLLVSDIANFAPLGGMVGLDVVSGRLAIRLNRGAARRVGLDFDVELLRLADEVLR